MAGALRDVPRHPEERRSLVSKESGTPQRDDGAAQCGLITIARRTRPTSSDKSATARQNELSGWQAAHVRYGEV